MIRKTAYMRANLVMKLFCCAMMAMSLVMLLFQLDYDRKREIDSAYGRTENMARAFQEHSLRTIQNVNYILKSLRDVYLKRGGLAMGSFSEVANSSVARYAVESRRGQESLFNLLSVVDASGDLVLSSQVPFVFVNVEERGYFKAHRDGKRGLLISPPLIGKATGKRFVPISLPMEDEAGVFTGLVLASVNPFMFSDFYGRICLGPGGVIAMVDRDGAVLAGVHDDRPISLSQNLMDQEVLAVMSQIPNGSLAGYIMGDGTKRILSFRQIYPYDVFVVVGETEDHVLSGFHRRKMVMICAVLLFDLLVLIFFAVFRSAKAKEEATEERFQSFFEQNSVGFAITSPDGSWKHVNDKLCHIVGYDREELSHMRWQDITPDEDRPREFARFWSLVERGINESFSDKRYVKKDGSVVEVEVSTHLMRDNDGSVIYLASTIQDISQRLESQRLLAQRAAELERHRETIINSMAILAEYRDGDTGGHIQRVKAYVKLLLERSGGDALFPTEDLPLIWQSAALHDIGKVAVPDSVLLKPGRLSEEEFDHIKIHPSVGGEVLARTEGLLGGGAFISYARDITEYHHEKWDGSGYPHGVKGEKIPFLARVMAIADVYDALVSSRPYKRAFSHTKAVSIIKDGSGSHFDPDLVNVFLSCEREFEGIYLSTP